MRPNSLNRFDTFRSAACERASAESKRYSTAPCGCRRPRPVELAWAITAAATTGLKDHDRWRGAHTLLARKLDNRRSTSRLGDLLDYVISRPLVSAEVIAKHLGISTTAARDLVRTFDLHEMTGRQRYRAW